jgi:tetratricopeptide (TPR) repeat protein
MHVELKDIRYDEVYGTGMVEGGSEVSIKVVLTNVSKEINESTFSFQSELVGAGGHVSVDGQPAEALQSGSSYTLKHKQVDKEVVVSWSGEAPEVGKRAAFTLLNVTQETTEGEYSVVDIKIDVTSQTIEDAIIAVNNAKEEIAKANEAVDNAEDAGLNVAGAKRSLDLANEYLNNSQQYYNEGRSEEALAEAEKALESAKDAEAKAESAVGGMTLRNYAIIAVVAVVVIIVFVLLLQQRKRKRGVY